MKNAYAMTGPAPTSSSPPARTPRHNLRLHIVRDADVFAAQVRALQSIYDEAHKALVNWGAWSRDLRNVYPAGYVMSPTWREALPSKFGDFGEVDENTEVVPQAEVKAESAEREAYDERAGLEIDRRMHEAGGLSLDVRLAVRAAYLSREIPEEQFPKFSGCSHDAFRERLEYALQFVGRFIGAPGGKKR